MSSLQNQQYGPTDGHPPAPSRSATPSLAPASAAGEPPVQSTSTEQLYRDLQVAQQNLTTKEVEYDAATRRKDAISDVILEEQRRHDDSMQELREQMHVAHGVYLKAESEELDARQLVNKLHQSLFDRGETLEALQLPSQKRIAEDIGEVNVKRNKLHHHLGVRDGNARLQSSDPNLRPPEIDNAARHEDGHARNEDGHSAICSNNPGKRPDDGIVIKNEDAVILKSQDHYTNMIMQTANPELRERPYHIPPPATDIWGPRGADSIQKHLHAGSPNFFFCVPTDIGYTYKRPQELPINTKYTLFRMFLELVEHNDAYERSFALMCDPKTQDMYIQSNCCVAYVLTYGITHRKEHAQFSEDDLWAACMFCTTTLNRPCVRFVSMLDNTVGLAFYPLPSTMRPAGSSWTEVNFWARHL